MFGDPTNLFLAAVIEYGGDHQFHLVTQGHAYLSSGMGVSGLIQYGNSPFGEYT